MSGIPMQYSNLQAEPEQTNTASSTDDDVLSIPGKSLRRWLFFTVVATTTALGVGIMFDILAANQLTWHEAILLLLFSITFGWITISFWSAFCGFFLQWFQRDPLTLKRVSTRASSGPINTRTAIVMPVYNEDTQRVIAGFEATLHSLRDTGELKHFDFFLLSDTTNAEVAQNELTAWHLLQQRSGDLNSHIYYRRREKNIGRKVGNLADFCQRWGSHYQHMIVLDADSVMTGTCLLQMVRAMQMNPQVGLIQTVPIPVRQTTFFGRFVQFAAVLYSPMLARGLAFWQTDAANYWGHNAIIRTKAFLDTCGLPTLPGKAPFGGDILSHDFVEAAMLRRAGWDVLLLADLEGSYEEVPCNIIDYAKRDRRWVQGNIQHLGLLKIAGLHTLNRLHFFLGAVAYISSLVWLLMLALSTADAVLRAINSNVYFTEAYQLFPNWPIAKTELIVSLISLTIGLLLLPKLMGIFVAIRFRNAEFGGTSAIVKGAFIETLFAILIAPLMMAFHAYFVISVFLGFNVNWDAQEREGRLLSWSEVFARTWRTTATALLWGAATFYFTPIFFWWLTPILTGLVLAAPIARYSSSLSAGEFMRRHKIFLCPSETTREIVLEKTQQYLNWAYAPDTHVDEIPALPAEQWAEMPVQDFALRPVRA